MAVFYPHYVLAKTSKMVLKGGDTRDQVNNLARDILPSNLSVFDPYPLNARR